MFSPDPAVARRGKGLDGSLPLSALSQARETKRTPRTPRSDDDEDILQEPSKCFRIQTLQEEIDSIKNNDKKDLIQKPDLVYLKYCKQYTDTQKNIETLQLKVDDYNISLEDLEKNVLNRGFISDLLMSGASLHLSQVVDEDFAKLFMTETLKVFTDFVFLDPDGTSKPQVNIIVKTWQKIKF